MLNNNDSAYLRDVLVNDACTEHFEKMHALENDKQASFERRRPSFLRGVIPFQEGDKWCALLGENLQTGIAGFGAEGW